MNSRTIAVSSLRQDVRDQFIRRTYAHLFGAIAAFTALEFYLFSSGLAGQILSMMSGLNWLWILGGFVVFSWMATHFARSTSSKGMQYFGLGLFVVAEAIIFVPLLAMAQQQAGGQVIESAALATMMGFTGLTTIAFFTRADFSWMGKILMFGGIGALVLIVCGALFGFQLGVFFSVGKRTALS